MQVLRYGRPFQQIDATSKGVQYVCNAKATKLDDIKARQIRLAAGLSQSEFAKLIGGAGKTLQNWEQHRTRPSGTARALLKLVRADPNAAIKALQAA